MDDSTNELQHNENQRRFLALERMMLAQGQAHAADMTELRTLISENTSLSVDIVSIMNFSKNTTRHIVTLGRFLSACARLLLPIVMLYGVIRGLQTGHFPSLKDLL